MKLGVDLRPLQTGHRYRGIGKYTQNLIETMLRIAPEHHFVLYIYGDLDRPELDTKATNFEWRIVPGGPPVGLEPEFFQSFRWRIKVDSSDLDAFLQPAVEYGRPTDCPSFCTMHDLIPLLFRREYYRFFVPRSLRELKRLIITAVNFWKYLNQLSHYRHFDGLIANSESTRRDTAKHLHYRKPIYLAVLNGNASVLKAGPTSPSDRVKQPFIMFNGGNDGYKNVRALVDAFDRIKLEGLQLVIAGKDFGHCFNDVANVVELPFVSDAELGWLMRHAEAYVLPSTYEGFGMPLLEAMQSGCPVICYNNSSLPEVVGDAALVVKTGEPLDAAIKRVHSDPALRKELIRKGLAQGALFTWERTARETLDVLTGAAHEAN